MRPPPVLIIGAHRSGTTATARALELLGLEIGRQLDSHREPKALQRLHDECLQRCDASWFHPDPFLTRMQSSAEVDAAAIFLREAAEQRFARTFGYAGLPGWWRIRQLKRGKPWGWKEPRTTLFARSWLRVFPDARIIHVLRHPVSVASSIRQRELKFRAAGDAPKPGLERLDYCLRLALTYAAAAEAIRSVAPHFLELHFESLQSKPADTLRQLSAFCGLKPAANRLAAAAGTIHPVTSPWDRLTADEIASVQPMAADLRRLGYEPAPGSSTEILSDR